MSKRHNKTGSKIQRYSVKAQVKLTNTKKTEEPPEIIDAKARLKATKKLTTSIETIANNLYIAQTEESRLLTQLSDKLSSANISSSEDRCGIFMNNMGRVSLNTQEIQQMYLINMKDQLIKPLTEFNQNSIGKCQELKLKLKAKKGQYDMKKKKEVKILNTQQTKNVNLQKIHHARSKSILKLDELQIVRNDFIASVEDMQKEKVTLLNGFQQYMDSYSAYTEIHAQNLKVQDKMHWMPPNVNNKFGLDSDTEDINDNDETMSTFTDWGKSSIIVREGWIKKRGKVNKLFKKRWFKLFINKKLIYLTENGANAKMKGHINLNKIIGLNKKGDKYIDINTKTRLWALQFETSTDRNGWYNAIMETKGTTIRQTVVDFGSTFVDNYYNKNSYDNLSPVVNTASMAGMPPPPSYDDIKQTNTANMIGMPPPSYDDIDHEQINNDSNNIAAQSYEKQEEILDETNPFLEEENVEGMDEKDDEKNETVAMEMPPVPSPVINTVSMAGMPPPSYDDIEHINNDSNNIGAQEYESQDDILEDTNPFFEETIQETEQATVIDTGQEAETIQQTETVNTVLSEPERNIDVGIVMRFVIVVDAIGLYEDDGLNNETFSMQIQKGEIVEGEYIDKKVVLLSKYKLYVSFMDIEEVPQEQAFDPDDNFV